MAAVELTVQSLSALELEDITFTAADTDGVYFANDGSTYVLIANGSGGSLDVVSVCQGCSHGLSENKTHSTAAANHSIVGPFRKDVWNDSNSRMNFTVADATSLTMAAIRL